MHPVSPLRLFVLFAALGLLVYFGLSTQSPEIRRANAIRSGGLEVTGVENLLADATGRLTPVQKAELDALNEVLSAAAVDSLKASALKELSGFWFRLGHHALAGSYARDVAELETSADSWRIAGMTFLYGLEGDAAVQHKLFCRQMAANSFEQALSLDPEEPAYAFYRAMAWVKFPDENAPMRGIQLLLELEKEQPEYLPVQLQLVELGMQTGQMEKAEARLQKILSQDPQQAQANCLMAKLLEQTGRTGEMEKYIKHCKR